MTKNHFKAIAKIIKDLRIYDCNEMIGDDLVSKQDLTYEICKYFKNENEAFDEERFVDACIK
jgi:hypothetical protein